MSIRGPVVGSRGLYKAGKGLGKSNAHGLLAGLEYKRDKVSGKICGYFGFVTFRDHRRHRIPLSIFHQKCPDKHNQGITVV